MFKQQLETDLSKQFVTSNILFSRFCLLQETARQTLAYSDPTYYPLYYHLGKYLQPKKLLELGFGLALSSGAFLQGCKTVEDFVAYKRKTEDYYNEALGKKNLKNVYKNNFSLCYGGLDELMEKISGRKFDLILVNEEGPVDEYRAELDLVWDHLNSKGFMIVDHVGSGDTKMIFENFCKIKNKDFILINSRYGTGVIER